jgi:hypothetical protein
MVWMFGTLQLRLCRSSVRFLFSEIYIPSNPNPKVARIFIGGYKTGAAHHLARSACACQFWVRSQTRIAVWLAQRPHHLVTPIITCSKMNSVPVCPTCMGHLGETTERHGSFSWAVVWRCDTCNVQFHCCDRSCGPQTRQIKAFASRDQLVRHHRRNHKQRHLNTDVAFVDTYSDAHHPVNALNDDASPGYYCIPTKAFEIFRVHLPTQCFFDDLQTHLFSLAVEGLVARSCFLDGRIRQPETTGISNTDLTLFFRIARLVFQIGPKQQHLLGRVLAGFETRYPPHHSNGSNEL